MRQIYLEKMCLIVQMEAFKQERRNKVLVSMMEC